MRTRSLRVVSFVAAALLTVGSGAAWAQDELFVSNVGSAAITVYARTASGNVAPLRTLSGAATGLHNNEGIAVDTVNDEVFVVNNSNSSVTVYDGAASGNAAPLRTISGAATGLNLPIGVAVDTVNNELVVTNPGNNSVTVYSRTANGNVAPLRTISGAATLLGNPVSASIDTLNNELVITDFNLITVYPRTANGNVAPSRAVAGAATGLNAPVGATVDTVNNELLVSNHTPSITVYTRTANGNVAPIRTISGAATGLTTPGGIALDTVNDEFAVADYGNNSIRTYARTANGNVAPLRTIAGAATGLNVSAFVAGTVGAAAGIAPPTVAVSFGASSILLNGSTSLIVTITNPNASSSLGGINLTDSLPAGLVVSTPNGLVDGCGGVTAVAGSSTISLVDIGLAANASCTFRLNVTGTTLGLKTDTTDAVTSDQGTGGTASASLNVVAVGPAPAATTVPTLQQWALWMLGVLLIISAGVQLHRRKRR